MNKKEIQNKYKEKIKLFNKLNKFYYDKSEPVASDQEYDILKKEILLLETKHKFLKSNNSPYILSIAPMSTPLVGCPTNKISGLLSISLAKTSFC